MYEIINKHMIDLMRQIQEETKIKTQNINYITKFI